MCKFSVTFFLHIIKWLKINKKCIYTMYIYRKREFCVENGSLSYGYLMDMLWVSFGNGCRMIAKW